MVLEAACRGSYVSIIQKQGSCTAPSPNCKSTSNTFQQQYPQQSTKKSNDSEYWADMRKCSVTTLWSSGGCWHGNRQIDGAEIERENFGLTLVGVLGVLTAPWCSVGNVVFRRDLSSFACWSIRGEANFFGTFVQPRVLGSVVTMTVVFVVMVPGLARSKVSSMAPS
jgi:hypothetical protein